MPLLDTLKGLVHKDREKFPDRPIDPSHVDHPFTAAPIKAGQDYFRFWLMEMFLKQEVAAFQTWYPAVHSLVQFQFGDKSAEIAALADPIKAMRMEATPKGDVIFRRIALTPLMPFNGGTVQVGAGLVALKGDANYLQRFVKVVGDFAGLLAVPQLSTAIGVAAPVATGVQELFAASSAGMHLGWFDTFVGEGGEMVNVLRAGYMAIVRAPAGALDRNRLWVINDMLHEGSGLGEGQHQALEDWDHMLFRFELREQRDDYDSLTKIYDPFNKALNALDLGSLETAETYYRAALAEIRASPDLTKADRIRMQEEFSATFKAAKEAGGYSGLVSTEALSIQRLMNQARSPASALEMGERSLEEILAEP